MKIQRLTQLKGYANAVKEGEINPLNFLAALKKLEQEIQLCKTLVEEEALDEIDKYPEKTIELDGFSVTQTSGGRYSYKEDGEWKELEKNKKNREKQMQQAYKTEGELVIDGEVIPPADYIPNKKSISIKIKK